MSDKFLTFHLKKCQLVFFRYFGFVKKYQGVKEFDMLARMQ